GPYLLHVSRGGSACPFSYSPRDTIFLLQRRVPGPVPGPKEGLCPAAATRRNRDGVDRSHYCADLPSHRPVEGHQQLCHASPLPPGQVRCGIQVLPRLLRCPPVTNWKYGLADRNGNVGSVGIQYYSHVLPSILSE